MKVNTKLTVALLIPIILLTSIGSLLLSARGAPPPSISYSFGLTTYSTEIIEVWDGESYIIDDAGSYSGTFNYTFGYENNSCWIEEERKVTYSTDYSFFQNTTITGNKTLSMNVDVYGINVSYGDIIDLTWMAVKNGTLTWDRYLRNSLKIYNFSVNSLKTTNTTYKKYDLANRVILLDEWNDITVVPDVWSQSGTEAEVGDDSTIEHEKFDVKFTTPLIMLYQIYTTNEGEKVAWSEMLGELVVYDDKDKNSIYSAAEGIATNSFDYYTSDEYVGYMFPHAYEMNSFHEIIYTDEPWKSFNGTSRVSYPVDKSIEEISDAIEFTEPTKQGNIVSWDIHYPDFPLIVALDTFNSIVNSTYANTSPGNYSYGFEYDIKATEADLSLTTELPKISNSTLYDAVQGYGLAMPHYSYFVSSTEIEKAQDLVITVPNNRFKFLANNNEVAQISMSNPNKTAYTLFDYPELGNQSVYDAIGSTVSNMIVYSIENVPSTRTQVYTDVIFSLDSYVQNDPDFVVNSSLFSIETQNYPVWSGEKLVHDPVFTAYYGETPDIPDPEGGGQPGFPMGILIGIAGTIIGVTSVTVIVLFVLKKRK